MNNASPLIAITSRYLREDGEESTAQGVRTTYLNSIFHFGGLPIVVPLRINPEQLRILCEHVAGFLIPGGEDVDPAFYNELPHERLGKTCRERDELEMEVIRFARQHKKPLLGICRGSQVMNVACGGTLYQDLTAQRLECPEHCSAEWEDLVDTLTIATESRLASILGTEKIKTNSLHHQAVKKIADGLTISATAQDGVIEALEDPGHPFFIGVQSHPETLWERMVPEWGRLFERFIEACQTSQD